MSILSSLADTRRSSPRLGSFRYHDLLHAVKVMMTLVFLHFHLALASSTSQDMIPGEADGLVADFGNRSWGALSLSNSSRRLADLVFVEAGETAVQSSELVITCTFHLLAPFPMGLVGEAALLLKKSVAQTLQLTEASLVTQLTSSSPNPPFSTAEVPDTLDWQAFQFGFVVLPPAGGSQDVAYMLRQAAESAILVKFKELILARETMKNVVVSDYWILLMEMPVVTEETVWRPMFFATWTSTQQPLPYIPKITTTTGGHPQSCASTSAPCTCAGISGCEWVKGVNGESRCQDGRNRVPCTACAAQEVCQAQTCGGLKSACLCAYSPLQCHWDTGGGTCLEGAGVTECKACATQSRCKPPEILSIVPASGTQLRMPAHKDLHIDFNTAVRIRQTGSVSFSCSFQQLPFYVPWTDVRASTSSTGAALIRVPELFR